jgi:hypothetical protein
MKSIFVMELVKCIKDAICFLEMTPTRSWSLHHHFTFGHLIIPLQSYIRLIRLDKLSTFIDHTSIDNDLTVASAKNMLVHGTICCWPAKDVSAFRFQSDSMPSITVGNHGPRIQVWASQVSAMTTWQLPADEECKLLAYQAVVSSNQDRINIQGSSRWAQQASKLRGYTIFSPSDGCPLPATFSNLAA